LRYWRHIGQGPKGTKFGRRVLYRRSDVDAWVASIEAAQRQQPA
jgi:predicted DNA-binding transcriptional regulator AlpA